MANDARILLDVSRLIWRRWVGRQPTGVDRVCLAYLEHFRLDAQAVVQDRRLRRILDRASSSELFDLLTEPSERFRVALLSGAIRRGLKRGMSGLGRPYFNVGHTNLNDLGFRDWIDRTDLRPIYFVHDLIPITHPEYCRSGEDHKHRARMRTVLETGAGLIANSNATLDELRDFARAERLSCPPSLAALLGSDALPPIVRSNHKLAHPTFVILGTIEARKNHLLLLQVWSRLAQRMGASAPHLKVIGKRGWECEQVVDLLDRSRHLNLSVTEINDCSDRALAEHIAGARALLFPSLVEGYGLPLVEALKAGIPVIASDLPVFREIAGIVPDYVDPLDGPAWERVILKYSSPLGSDREAQILRMRKFQAPTWDDHFSRVANWLATL